MMNEKRTRVARLVLVVAALAGAVWVRAGDLNPPAGPITPTQRTPIGASTTPGDADSLFRISQPGSYYLTGNITGNVSGSVGSVTGNVGGNVVGTVASVVTIDEDSTTLDLDATIRAAVGLSAANLDTQLSTIDTVVDAIKVITDALGHTWEAVLDHSSHPDSNEGGKAFLERRKPRWAPYTGK